MGSSLNGTGVTFSNGTTQASARTGPGAQLFTASGTFTVPAGITSVLVAVVGGGGGGGAGTYRGTGGSGGQGGWAVGTVAVTPGASVTVTVGAGGAGVQGTGGTNYIGGTGGTSSFGSISATGGTGGGHLVNSPYRQTGVTGTGSGGNLFSSASGSYTSALGYFAGVNSRYISNSTATNPAVAYSPSAAYFPGAFGSYVADGCTAVYYGSGAVGGAVLIQW